MMATHQQQIERAKKAYEVFNNLTPILSGFAEALSGKSVTVKAGDKTATDGKTITVRPPIALADEPEHVRALCDKRDDTEALLCPACAAREGVMGYMFHEMSHVIFGSFDVVNLRADVALVAESIADPEIKGRFLRNTGGGGSDGHGTLSGMNKFGEPVLNALEDLRVDSLMVNARPGVGVMHRTNFHKAQAESNWKSLDLNVQLTLAVMAKSMGIDAEDYFDEYVNQSCRDAGISRVVGSVHLARSVRDSVRAALCLILEGQRLGFFIYDDQHCYVAPVEPDAPDADPEPDEDAGGQDADGAGESPGQPVDDTDVDGGGDGEGGEYSGDVPDDGDSEGGNPGEAPDGAEGSGSDANDSGVDDGEGSSSEGQDSDGNSSASEPQDSDGDSSGGEGGASSAGGEPSVGDATGDGSPSSGAGGDSNVDGDSAPGGAGDVAPVSDGRDVRPGDDEGDDGEDVLEGHEGPGHGGGADGADDGDASGGAPLPRPSSERFGSDADEVRRVVQAAAGHSGETEFDMSAVEASAMGLVVTGLEHFDEISGAIERVKMLDISRRGNRPFDSISKPTPESVLGPATLHMRRAFADNDRSDRDRNRRSGRINSKVLGRRAWGDDDRLFAKRTRPGKRDYAVLIGIDASGSTGALGDDRVTTIELELRAAKAQAELCARMGIKFAVYAHTGSSAELVIVPIKEFDEGWGKKQIERMGKVRAMQANLDGHTIEFYRKELEKIRATDKILMYYSDGAMPAENYHEELRVLKREIKTFASKGMTLMAVGARTSDPRKHGLDTVRIDGIQDIAKVVQHLGKRIQETR